MNYRYIVVGNSWFVDQFPQELWLELVLRPILHCFDSTTLTKFKTLLSFLGKVYCKFNSKRLVSSKMPKGNVACFLFCLVKFAQLVKRGIKYTYDASREKWERVRTCVRIARKPFEEGGMRTVYRMDEIDDGGDTIFRECWCICRLTGVTPFVAKVFKEDEGDDAYFDEAMTQMVAESWVLLKSLS